MPVKGWRNPDIYDADGKKISWKVRNREKANTAARNRRRLRQELNPDKEYALRRKWFLKHKFGITPELREIFIIAQDYKCAICGTTLDIDSSKWATDHSHSGNFVRGMLCKPCNSALGLFKDSIQVLKNAVTYLEQTSSIPNEPSTEDFESAIRTLEKVWQIQKMSI